MHFETTVTTEAPASRAWDALEKIDKWSSWTDSVTEARWLDGASLTVGSRASIKQPGMPALVWEVSEVEPGRSFAWVTSGPGIRTVGSHRVDETGPGRSTITLTLAQTGPLSSIIGLFTSKRSKRFVQMEAEGLRRCAETNG
jgi:uncharacterized membrane protein